MSFLLSVSRLVDALNERIGKAVYWLVLVMVLVSSGSAGGLIRWPALLLVPAGFFLLSLQGISELIKRVAFLKGLIPDPLEKHEVPMELGIARDEAAK